MNSKSGVFEKFKEFEAIATNESEQCIGTLRTDNSGEYVSKEFEAYLKSKGIKHQLTTAYTPEQNGVAERMNRTIMESARAMLSHANVPGSFWAEAVATAGMSETDLNHHHLLSEKTRHHMKNGMAGNQMLVISGCLGA